MNLKKYAGVLLVIAGLIMLFPFSATGAVIGTALTLAGPFFGLIFLIGGLILMISSLEDESSGMNVYTAKARSGKEEYHLIDPTLTLGGADLTLDEFQRGIDEIRYDPDLMKLVRRTYLRPLQRLRSSGGKEKGLAEEFLKVIGIEQNPEEPYTLSSGEKKQIKEAFKIGYDKNDKRQSRILRHYGIDVGPTKGGHIRFSLNENSIVNSSTPSDYKSLQNFVIQLIHFINENYTPR